MNKLLIILISLCLGFAGQGQSNATLAYSQHFSENDLNHTNFFEKKKALFGIDASTTLEPMYEYTSKAGVAHYKYQQHYKGLPIVGQVFFLDEKEGKVFRSRGNLVPSLDIAIEPKISKEAAQQSAKNRVWAQLLKESPEMPKTRGDLPEIAIEKEELVIIASNYPSKQGNYVLANKIRVAAPDKHLVQDVYINANDGGFIFKNDVAKQHNVPAIAKTRYYGDQQIIVDSLGPNKYELIDRSRGGYVVVYGSKEAPSTKFTDTDKYWEFPEGDKSQVALDAFYCAEKFYDLMFNQFGWRGINGNGSPIIAIVQNDKSGGLTNAFWNGDYAYFGKGYCEYGPLTTLEVVGHEFMHGITESTSDLVYDKESGAINEGMSDCFGKALEWVNTPEYFSWDLGHSFILSAEAEPFRSFSDPKKYNCPEMYEGELWNSDNNVHTNSSILNYWFYLMVQGKTGINENNVSYEVPPNNLLDVIHILWLCQSAYLMPNSNYNDLANASLLVTSELYGENSSIYEAAQEAWKAVNLPYDFGSIITDLSVEFANTENLCDSVFIPIFKIINTGTVALGENTMVTLNFNGHYENIILPVNFKSGDTLTYTNNQWMEFLYDDYHYSFCSIEFQDDFFDNNTSYDFFKVWSPTLKLVTSAAVKAFGNCFTPDSKIPIFLENKSCVPTLLNSNSYVELIDATNNAIIGRVNLEEKWLSNENGIDVEMTLDYSKFSNQNGLNDLIFRTVHEGKSYVWQSFYFYVSTKEGLYENKLDVDADVKEFILNGEFTLASYNNKVLLKTAFNDVNVPLSDCHDIDVQGLLDTNHSFFEVCFDASSISQPALSFDAVLFNADGSNAPFNSYIKVAYSGYTYDLLAFIHDIPEGEIRNFVIPLYHNFEGTVQFDFYSASPDLGFGENYDYQMIDNIKIIDLTATNELPVTESQDAFYPNPSNGLWHYQAALGKVEQLSCVDPLGKPYTLTMQDNEVNAQHLSPGLYFLRWKANGQYYVQKMVVMQ